MHYHGIGAYTIHIMGHCILITLLSTLGWQHKPAIDQTHAPQSYESNRTDTPRRLPSRGGSTVCCLSKGSWPLVSVPVCDVL